MIVKGYQYITEQEAINARKLAADYKGYPTEPGNTTIYWVNYSYASENVPPFWYIQYVKDLEKVLGEPTEFEVITIDPDL